MNTLVSTAQPVGKVPLFCGGIGDVFLQCCTSDRYRILSADECPKIVLNASRNEYADELFRWHPNRDRFNVVRAMQPDWDRVSKRDFYRSLGLDEASMYEGSKGQQLDWSTRFYPAPQDMTVLAEASHQRFGVFAPFSKDAKTLPDALCKRILHELQAMLQGQVSVFGFARGYQTINHRVQDLRPYADAGWLTDLSAHDLSVPGSFELARQADFYVGANSCLALVTMSQGKPTVIIEPTAHSNPNVWPRLFNLNECVLIQKLDAVDLDAIIAFLAPKM